MPIEKLRFDEISVLSDVIETSKSQARQKNANENIEELAQSIELQGLFSPILLIEMKNNKFELIAGQRRMRAYRDILMEKNPEKFNKIPAFIYKNSMTDWEKKAISINENFNQVPMTDDDKIAAVTSCFNEFDSIRITSEKTGIPERQVKNYVKYTRLPSVLKIMKDKGQISLRTALDTANLFELDTSDIGDIPEEEINTCASEMENLTSVQKKFVKARKKHEPTEKIIDVIKHIGSKPDEKVQISIEVVSHTHKRVDIFRKKKGFKTINLAASELVEDGLDVNEI